MMDALGNIPSQYRWVMVAMLPVLLAAGYWYFMYSPTADQIAQLDRDIIREQKTLDKYIETEKNFAEFEARVTKLEHELEEASTQLPNQEEIPELIQKVSELVVESGLDITHVRPHPELPHEYYAEKPITLKMTGSYHALGQFFNELARLPRIISVSKMKFDGRTLENKTHIEAECLATTYRFLEEGEAGPGPADKKKTRRKS